jgi:hypothetical protein
MPSINWKLQPRSLVREGVPHQQTCNCVKIIKERKEKNWSRVPDGSLMITRLTVGRNITSTLTTLQSIIDYRTEITDYGGRYQWQVEAKVGTRFEYNVSQELLWVWQGDSSGTQEGKRMALETGTRGLVKRQQARKTKVLTLMNCRLLIGDSATYWIVIKNCKSPINPVTNPYSTSS